MKTFKQIAFEGFLDPKGNGSEKRLTKFQVVVVMLALSIFDTVVNWSLRIEVLTAWLGLIGWDGWRSTKEKKDDIIKDKEAEA